MIDALRRILQVEGWAGLYKGIVPSTIKAAPAGAVTFVAYELTSDWLESILTWNWWLFLLAVFILFFLIIGIISFFFLYPPKAPIEVGNIIVSYDLVIIKYDGILYVLGLR